ASPMTPLFALLTEREARDAEILGKAMRFGAMFSVKDPSNAGTLNYQPKKNVLELKLTRVGQALFGEVARARFESLCKSMEVTPVVAE
ncbi:MAG: exopolyphosphatase, partial [Paracoccus sp. (in: a-proteobacteria)]